MEKDKIENIRKELPAVNSCVYLNTGTNGPLCRATAEVMKDKFSSLASKTIKKADKALQSVKTEEAKIIGKQAIGIAKTAISSAIKSAQDVIEKK